MKSLLTSLLLLAISPALTAAEYKHVGDFLLQSHYKITGAQVVPVPMKALAFRVFTDGVHIRISAEGNEEAHTTFEIYRSDGIGRQRQGAGALEVIPGLQAMTTSGGTLRHLRLSRESMTLTTFPGVSDQTIVSHAVAAEPRPETAQTSAKPVIHP